MAKTRYFSCVSDPSHMISIDLDDQSFKRLVRRFNKGQRSCPTCKLRNPPENNRMVECDEPKTTSIAGDHILAGCRHGHTTEISAFSSGMLHIKWGDDSGQFENIPGGVDDVAKLLDSKEIRCHHTIERKRGWSVCNCKLNIITGEVSIPNPISIKTKIRVGDVWDKENVARPIKGGYDNNGDYKPSEFDSRSARRINDMQKRGKIEIYNDKTNRREFVKRKRLAKPKGDIK